MDPPLLYYPFWECGNVYFDKDIGLEENPLNGASCRGLDIFAMRRKKELKS